MPGKPANSRSAKGTVNPAGIIRGSGGVRVASQSATPGKGRRPGNLGRGRVK
jgi:hypothetical protein